MSALGDRTRSRLLLVLERGELTVTEACQALRLPQSTASRHLRVLADGGWVRSRRDGTQRLYRMEEARLGDDARDLWRLVREQTARGADAGGDARRLRAVLAKRRRRSREFFASAAARWDRLRDRLFGERFYLHGLLGLLDDGWTVGDLGCGTGRVAELLAPYVHRVIAVDDSESMLRAAGERLRSADNVELRCSPLERMSIPDGTLDAATLVLVLQHLPDPGRVLAEAGRVLRPGGRLLLVDMLPHERTEYREEMGHVWTGFSEERIRDLARETALDVRRFQELPPDPEAQGPPLFAAVLASRRESPHASGGGIREKRVR